MKEETKTEIRYFVVAALIVIAVLVLILGVFYNFFSAKQFWDFMFKSMFDKESDIVPSFFEICIPIATAVIALWGIKLLNRRTAASEAQAVTAHTDSERNELEKIEKDYREAVKDLTSKDHNTILMACTTIKQIVVKRPDDFLETTYKVLFETLHSSFHRTKLVRNNISEIAEKVKENANYVGKTNEIRNKIFKLQKMTDLTHVELNDGLENYALEENDFEIYINGAIDYAIKTSKVDLSDVHKFQNCFETLGQIRNFKTIIAVEEKLGLRKLLEIHDIDFGFFDDHSIDVIGNFTVENASFEKFTFYNCDFSSIVFRKTNFCYYNFFVDQEFNDAHAVPFNSKNKTRFIKCILQAEYFDEFGFDMNDNFLWRTPTYISKCDVFTYEATQYKKVKSKVQKNCRIYDINNFEIWKSIRKAPNSMVDNDTWLFKPPVE